MKKMWEKVLLFVWLWCIIILSFIILTVRRIFMINFLNTAAQMVAAKSTISPDQKIWVLELLPLSLSQV